jgi:hypothetical protein
MAINFAVGFLLLLKPPQMWRQPTWMPGQLTLAKKPRMGIIIFN